LTPGDYSTLDFVESSVSARNLIKLSELTATEGTFFGEQIVWIMTDRFLTIATINPADIAKADQASHRDYRPYFTCASIAMLGLQ
jgi:hypothetical protein